jgi:hypothetical protein
LNASTLRNSPFLFFSNFFRAVTHARVPERREVIRDRVHGVRGVHFPIGRQRRLCVGNVEETVLFPCHVSKCCSLALALISTASIA